MPPSSLKPETDTGVESDTEALPARSPKETAQLVVTAPIAIGAVRGPQLLAVTVTPSGKDSASGKPFEAVTKIFDPLYYSFESEIGHHPKDCVYIATNDLIQEASAYECLHRAGQTGSFAPEFHGCWSFSLPIKLRSISLVLIERLNGVSILSTRIRNSSVRRRGLDSFYYPEEFRLEVLARAMDGYVRLLRAGVMQRDFAARNLVLVPQNPTAPPQTVHGHVLAGSSSSITTKLKYLTIHIQRRLRAFRSTQRLFFGQNIFGIDFTPVAKQQDPATMAAEEIYRTWPTGTISTNPRFRALA